jgi:hypothetical protein
LPYKQAFPPFLQKGELLSYVVLHQTKTRCRQAGRLFLGLEFCVQDLKLRDMLLGVGLRVEGSRLRVSEFRVEDSGFGFSGLGFKSRV